MIAELRAIHASNQARAKADAAVADAEARLPIEEAELEAEEKYIALSESGSSVTVSGRYKNKLRLSIVVASGVPKIIDQRFPIFFGCGLFLH